MECSSCMVVGVKCNAVDLSYALNDATIFWPGGEKFKLCMDCSICPEFGYHYAAGVFSCAEHGGTHVDAPFHFSKDGKTVDLLPAKDLIAPCRVIDISNQCEAEGPNYSLSIKDIENYETEYGYIEDGCIVLVRTGWAKRWQLGPKEYLGFDEASDGTYDSAVSCLSFPGISIEAAKMLVSRRIAAVGLDTGLCILLKSDFMTFTLLFSFYYLQHRWTQGAVEILLHTVSCWVLESMELRISTAISMNCLPQGSP